MDPKDINYALLPVHMRDAVQDYIEIGKVPEPFLGAIMANDFLEAVGQADDVNRRYLPEWAQFIYMEAPHPCHGSKTKVEQWVADGGFAGLQSKANAEG